MRDTVLEVDLPAPGTYFTLPATPGIVQDEIALFICHTNSGASIIISAVTANEISRSPGDGSAGAILDRIAGSARIRSFPEPAAGPGMQPPRTGDGGLR